MTHEANVKDTVGVLRTAIHTQKHNQNYQIQFIKHGRTTQGHRHEWS